MKKKIILIIALLIFSPLLLVGCGCNQDSLGVQLSQPSYIEVIKNNDKTLLYTDKNPCATHYLFYICKKEDVKDDLSKYIPLTKTSKNYIDVTSEFIYNQDYYFYVQTIDETGTFSKSIPSKYSSYTNVMTLSTPTIYMEESTIYWNKIKNATKYEIYLNNNILTITSDLSFNISSFNNGSLLNNSDNLNFKIKAIAPNSVYTTSNESNEISYVNHLNPVAPVISLNNKTLTINKVLNAKKYEITISHLTTETYIINAFDSNKKEIDLNNFFIEEENKYIDLLSQVGQYNISVRSISNDYYSDYSNSVNAITTQKLETPTILSSKINSINNNLVVSIKLNDNISKSIHIEIRLDNTIISKNVVLSNEISDIIFTTDDLNISDINLAKGKQVTVYTNGVGSYYLNSNTVSSIIY